MKCTSEEIKLVLIMWKCTSLGFHHIGCFNGSVLAQFCWVDTFIRLWTCNISSLPFHFKAFMHYLVDIALFVNSFWTIVVVLMRNYGHSFYTEGINYFYIPLKQCLHFLFRVLVFGSFSSNLIVNTIWLTHCYTRCLGIW